MTARSSVGAPSRRARWRVTAVVLLPLACQSQADRERLGTELARYESIRAVNVRVARVEYRGRDAVAVAEDSAAAAGADVPLLAILDAPAFSNGTIALEIAGTLPDGASAIARGFVGIAFHLQGAGERYQVIYLRPTNARALDQARRNHTAQYQAIPGYPWSRLRAEEPSVYESYVDIVAGEWTRMRIELDGDTARLFVNGAQQPTLIVNDLKTPDRTGRVALWIGPETVGYFTALEVTEAPERR